MVSGGVAGMAAVLAACDAGGGRGRGFGSPVSGSGTSGGGLPTTPPALLGRLTFRPRQPVETLGRTGYLDFTGSEGERLGRAYVPPVEDARPMRLVVLLHGAGGEPGRVLHLLLPFADLHRLLLLAPKSQLPSWDVIHGSYGPDVRRIDQLLEDVTTAYPVSGLAVGGFSDGASYALSLGIGNGDIFDSVLAFSPGFSAAQVKHGEPRFFISHGTSDPVLPIDVCSRRIVPELENSGYDVTYKEFDGGHTAPRYITREAADWLTGVRQPR